jgi:hypothetical protein
LLRHWTISVRTRVIARLTLGPGRRYLELSVGHCTTGPFELRAPQTSLNIIDAADDRCRPIWAEAYAEELPIPVPHLPNGSIRACFFRFTLFVCTCPSLGEVRAHG